jgi:outer membrane protein insertion porin family
VKKTCLRADNRVKSLGRLLGASLLLGCATAVWAQNAGPKIDRVDIKFLGPATVSEQFVRSNIRLKAGDFYRVNLTQDDVHALYGTGQFYNIRISTEMAEDGGLVLTYSVQVRPRVTEIKFQGLKKVKESKLRKKLTVKVGDALDEQKLFTDEQEMQKLYEKFGYPDSTVKYVLNVDEKTGHGIVTFNVVECPKVRIIDIHFDGAKAFTEKVLRKQLKTARHGMWSWITGSGVLNSDDFAHDREALADYYRDHGYLDFEIKDVQMAHPTTNTLVIRFQVYEGRQYKVGSVKITGNKLYTLADIRQGILADNKYEHSKDKTGPNALPMDVGDTFTPDGFNKDREKIEDFYGSKGYIEVNQGDALRALHVPNVEVGTMDLEFQVDEGLKSRVEKIDIRGNLKTKDKVIRRELAISPGETLDMVRVKVSKERLKNMQYFDKVELQPEPTDPPITGRKNLVVSVEEQNTGNLTFGAGFSSQESVVAYVQMTQANFDLFHPPYFTGGGQKLRIRVQMGTQRQDYEISFIEPWFLNHKLALGVDLYRHVLDFESPHNIFDETRTGASVSLTRALWSDFLIGKVSYTVEEVGISLNSGWHGDSTDFNQGDIVGEPPQNVPDAILNQQGYHLYQRVGTSLAYDTRNSTQLPNHGQRTEASVEFSSGDTSYYKLEAKNDWYFPGFFKGHVLDVQSDVRTAQSVTSGEDVPFYDRYYLGGMYNLRGFKFRDVSPRQPVNTMNTSIPTEPIGGDNAWFGSLEYSVPIIEKEGSFGLRIAAFYDIGAVGGDSYKFSGDYDDDWGLGFRLNIPHLGPLRLDYGIPIRHDQYNGTSGQFQFGVGFTRDF